MNFTETSLNMPKTCLVFRIDLLCCKMNLGFLQTNERFVPFTAVTSLLIFRHRNAKQLEEISRLAVSYVRPQNTRCLCLKPVQSRSLVR